MAWQQPAEWEATQSSRKTHMLCCSVSSFICRSHHEQQHCRCIILQAWWPHHPWLGTVFIILTNKSIYKQKYMLLVFYFIIIIYYKSEPKNIYVEFFFVLPLWPSTPRIWAAIFMWKVGNIKVWTTLVIYYNDILTGSWH